MLRLYQICGILNELIKTVRVTTTYCICYLSQICR